MAKTSWAKGRKQVPCTIAISPSTRDFAREIAYQERLTIKELVAIAVTEYAMKRGLTT